MQIARVMAEGSERCGEPGGGGLGIDSCGRVRHDVEGLHAEPLAREEQRIAPLARAKFEDRRDALRLEQRGGCPCGVTWLRAIHIGMGLERVRPMLLLSPQNRVIHRRLDGYALLAHR